MLINTKEPEFLNQKNVRRTSWTAFCLVALSFFTSDLLAEDLLKAPKEAPRFQISGQKVSQRTLTFSYKRTKLGEDPFKTVFIRIKNGSGLLDVSNSVISDSKGERVFSLTFVTGGRDFEIYLVCKTNINKEVLVSNIARIGNTGSVTTPRQWTKEEKQKFEREKLAKVPPSSIPKGHVAVGPATKLLPGMPIKSGHYTEWIDSVVAYADGDDVVVKPRDQELLRRHPREKWLAIEEKVLALGRDAPDRFKRGFDVLPGSLIILQEDTIPVDSNLELPEGTPLEYDYGTKWHEVYVLKTVKDKIKFRFKGWGSRWDKLEPRSKFAISENVLGQLKDPDAVKTFASNILLEESVNGKSKSSRIKEYPVKIDVPKRSQFVPEDLTIAEGTPLAACWGGRWRPITAISENENGTLYVHWDEYSDTWNCNMKRSQLIIENKTIAKLKRDQKEGAEETASRVTAEDLRKRLRTWTDSSGEHKIEAYYISHTAKKLVLKTAAGREIKMPFNKLGSEDQELLKSLGDGKSTDNPFD